MKYFVLLSLVFIGLQSPAQNKKGKNLPPPPPAKEAELEIYAQALKYGDAGVAVNCLYILINRHPDNIAFKDSLAQVYFQVGSYGQCINVCKDILQTKPNDTLTLRMLGISYQNNSQLNESLNTFSKLATLAGNVYDIYQKAILEYQLKYFAACKASVELLLDKASRYDKVNIYMDEENKQEVYLRAAVYNLYGMISNENHDTATARSMFSKAVEISPDFYLALSNLKTLDELSASKQVPPDPANTEKKKGK